MAKPVLGKLGDIIVEVEFDPVGAPGVYTAWCGATSASLSIKNDIVATKVIDCADLTAVVQTEKLYGAQDVSISIDANWTAATHKEAVDWALNQKSLNVQVRYPNAASGQPSTLTGIALIEGLDLGEIMNPDGNPQSQQVSLQFSGGVTAVNAI
jgi:hypothetical protein